MKGTVVTAMGRFYTVEKDGTQMNCGLRGRIRKDPALRRYSEPVAVGDLVDFSINDDGETGTIEEILERTNVFTRKDRGRRREDLIAANLDQIVIIQSFSTPKLNLRFVDRLIVRGMKEGIPAIVCVNKADLAGRKDIEKVRSYYSGTDQPLFFTSAKTGRSLKDFSREVRGRLSILTGSSGVGKSTILNALFPGLNLRTSEVSASTGKGRHTTTNVSMVNVGDGTRLIDTPGLREFGLMDIEPEQLGSYFFEFPEYAHNCAFSPCTHDHEPDCEVKRQVEKGAIHEERYISYLNILYSLKEYYGNRYK